MLATAVGTDARGSPSVAVLRRFSGPVRRPAFWIALWAAIAAAEIVALSSIVFAAEPVPGYRALFRLVGGAFAVCGVIGWRRRPDSYTGPLMVATGFGLLVEPIFAQFDSPTIGLFGDLLEDAWGIPAIALLLSFLSGGRVEGSPARLLVAATILQQVAELARHLFLEREGNFLLLSPNAGAADAFGAVFILLSVVACLGTAALIGVQFTRASRPHRRAMLPSVAGISCLILFAVANSASSEPLAWLAVSSLLVIPAAFLAGLLRSRLARGGVADLFGEIRTMRGPELQLRLAKAAGDQSLVVAYRHADAYADAAARRSPCRRRPAAPTRASTAARWSTTPRSTRTRAWWRSSPRRRRSRSTRTGSRSSRARPGSASSRPATPSGGGSSAICTTAPSSGSSRWRSSCG